MKITIASTDQITEVDGTQCRVWRGETEGGARCLVYVTLVAAHGDDSQEEFERELSAADLVPTVLTPFWQTLRE